MPYGKVYGNRRANRRESVLVADCFATGTPVKTGAMKHESVELSENEEQNGEINALGSPTPKNKVEKDIELLAEQVEQSLVLNDPNEWDDKDVGLNSGSPKPRTRKAELSDTAERSVRNKNTVLEERDTNILIAPRHTHDSKSTPRRKKVNDLEDGSSKPDFDASPHSTPQSKRSIRNESPCDTSRSGRKESTEAYNSPVTRSSLRPAVSNSQQRTKPEAPASPTPSPRRDAKTSKPKISRQDRPAATSRLVLPKQSTATSFAEAFDSPKVTDPKKHVPLTVLPALYARSRRASLPSVLTATSFYEAFSNPYAKNARPLLDLTLDPSLRREPVAYSNWANRISQHLKVTKIAEASYAEVYRLSLLKPDCTNLTEGDESVVKIIPLKPPPSKAASSGRMTKAQKQILGNMSDVADVASEVRLLKCMSSVPGFANFRDVRVVQGRPPKEIVQAWRGWVEGGRKSDWPDPGVVKGRKCVYGDTQLWAVVEMQDAGVDVEGWCEKMDKNEPHLKDDADVDVERDQAVRSVFGVWDIFWGVALAVAKGEESAEFEHRDLHLGNVCMRLPRNDQFDPPRPKRTMWQRHRPGDPAFRLTLNNPTNFTGVETTIIDYTLSRANLSTAAASENPASPRSSTNSMNGGSPPDISTLSLEDSPARPKEKEAASKPDVAFKDLVQDPEIFESDKQENYQYDIYRYMRNVVLHGCPTVSHPSKGPKNGRGTTRALETHTQDDTSTSPWEKYTPLTNLVWLHFVLYDLTERLLLSWPSSSSKPDTSNSQKREKEEKKALEIEGRLHVLSEVLDVETLGKEGSGIRSVGELVAWAVDGVGWFGWDDVLS